VSQISIATTADHAAPAVHETELLLVETPPDGVPNAEVPIEFPPAVYPVADSSVPFAVFDPCAVISRSLNGGVTVNADPPDVYM